MIFNHFCFKTCAIISVSWRKVHFVIHTKHLKGESSKSARKTAKVKQNRRLVMSLQQHYILFITYAVSSAILLLCTFIRHFSSVNHLAMVVDYLVFVY